MVNYEPIYDINGTWEVHFNFPKMIDQKLLDQCDEVWKKIKLTFIIYLPYYYNLYQLPSINFIHICDYILYENFIFCNTFLCKFSINFTYILNIVQKRRNHRFL